MNSISFPVFLVSYLFSIFIFSQTDWELSKNKDGIKVYTREIIGKAFRELKAEATFPGTTLHTIFAVFKDVDNANKWTCNLEQSYSLKEVSEVEFYNYFEVFVPWPIRNRDAISHVKAYQDKTDKSLIIDTKSAYNFIPVVDGIVRVKDIYGYWKFTPHGNSVNVDVQLYADPEGFPVWLVNLFAIDGPYRSIKSLREVVKNEKYKNKKFDFIKE